MFWGRVKTSARSLVVSALLVSVSGVGAAADRVKLTGAELAERYARYEVIAGLSHDSKVSWMIVAYGDGTRDMYWNDGITSAIDSGTYRIVGDQWCVVWRNIFRGEERCYDIYRIGPGKYESWRNGELSDRYVKIR